MDGPLPSELGSLRQLTYLDIRADLTGTIPARIGSLEQLTHLGLSTNKLRDPIPEELFDLANLEHLSLSSNDFRSTEFGRLTKLHWIGIVGNLFVGSIPTEFGNLSNLQSFMAGCWEECDMNTRLPPEWGTSMMSLQTLSLINTGITGTLPNAYGNLSLLRELYLYDNQLSGSLPREFGALSNLRNLYLNNNDLSGSIPIERSQLTSISTFDLSNNTALTGTIPIIPVSTSNRGYHVSGTDIAQLDGSEAEWCEFQYNYASDCYYCSPQLCCEPMCLEGE